MQYQWDSECRAHLLPDERESAIVQARLKSIAPHQFSPESASQQFWLDCFQNTLHSMLEGYLNGAGLGVVDRLKRRPMESPRGVIKDCIDRAWSLAADKLSWNALADQITNSESVPAQLVELHKHLDQATKETLESRKQIHVQPNAASIDTEPPELSKIRRVSAKTLRELECDLFVQGSVATDEQIGYSDLDLWLVVSRKALSDVNSLQQLAKMVFAIRESLFDFDPLQHHGVMLASEIDASAYSESFLPVEALAKARYVTPESGTGLLLHPRDSTIDAGIALFNLVCLFRKTAIEQTQHSEVYQVKSLLSCFMLLPSFFEAACGRPCFKGDSFSRVRKQVPKEIGTIMDEVSLVRQQWQYQPSGLRRCLQYGVRNPFTLEYLMRRGLSGRFGRVVSGQFPDNWQQRMLTFAEFLWKAVCK